MKKQMHIEEIQTQIKKVEGKRRGRLLTQGDVVSFIELVANATPEQHSIRVYSSGGFVPNSYKYRVMISYLQAERDVDTGEFAWGVFETDAKRSKGRGALITVNGRAYEPHS